MTGLPADVRRVLAARRIDPLDVLALTQQRGLEFLASAVQWLRDTFELRGVLVGEIGGPRASQLVVHVRAARGARQTVPAYDLDHTPADEILRTEAPVYVPSGAPIRYPNDAALVRLGIESFAGVPLHDWTGRTVGLLLVVDDRPITDLADLRVLLEWLGERVAPELTMVRTARNMLAAVEWMSVGGGADLYDRLTVHFARTMQVASAFIAEWSDDGAAFRVRALADGGESHRLAGSTHGFDGTPCAGLKSAAIVMVPDGALARFPNAAMLRAVGGQSYLGLRLDDRQGRPLGHLGLMHGSRMQACAADSPIIRIFASRVTAELERVHEERRRHQVEQTLLARQKMESIGLMAGAIAHDFNNLLVSILGNTSLALDQLPQDAPTKTYLARIETAAVRAGEMVSQLLDYAGRRSPERRKLDLSSLVRETMQLVQLSRHPKARLEFDLGAGLSMVLVDPTQIQQLLVNLVLNAAEALEGADGAIRVRTRGAVLTRDAARRLLHGERLEGGRFVVLEVEDTGVGMDEATAARVFDPFFTRKPNGRGLGLAMVQGIARSHGAAIRVTSWPAMGTTMAIYFPAAGSDELAPSAERDTTSAAPALERPVLVVDDEESVRTVAVALLESAGQRAVGCGGGEEALVRARAGERFGAALIDITMPQMDGWVTLDELRKIDPQLPIVMMSGYAQGDASTALARERRAEFLSKPFRRRDLEDVLGRVAARPPC